MTTPGGPGQTLSMVQVLTNLVDRGMELTTAIEYPRWSVGLDGSFMLEDGYAEEIAAELGRRRRADKGRDGDRRRNDGRGKPQCARARMDRACHGNTSCSAFGLTFVRSGMRSLTTGMCGSG